MGPGHGHGHGHAGPAQVGHGHGHAHGEAAPPTAREASGIGIRAAWVGLAGMAATALLQVVIVALSGSIALLADTLHNVGHLITTVPLLLAFRLGRRAPTRRYPYGFRRAEDLVGLLVAAVIALSAGLIVWESVQALADPRPPTHLGWVLAAGLVGALGNELVAVHRIRAGRRIGSAALVAEGQHARADGLTSVAVVVGVVGVWLGLPWADPAVGLVIAGVIAWILVDSTRTVVRRLMDGVEDGVLDQIERVAGGVEGVVSVDRIRARWTGHRLEAALDVAVDPALDLLSAHAIAETVQHALLHEVAHLQQAAVHVDPADTPDAHALTGHHTG